jgi:hypothetical protein
MKALKFLFTIALALSLRTALADGDSYIYWMVKDAHYYLAPNYYIPFDYATISIDGGSTYLHMYGSNDGQGLVADMTGLSSAGAALSGAFDRNAATSFLVELWSYDSEKRVGWMNYSSASLGDYIYTTAGAPGAASGLVVSQVVPEPTSGVLLLLGMAGLALRRRKMA